MYYVETGNAAIGTEAFATSRAVGDSCPTAIPAPLPASFTPAGATAENTNAMRKKRRHDSHTAAKMAWLEWSQSGT
jgi:hypothetical protein